jgi:mannan polymerase II complex ANP1 subunit
MEQERVAREKEEQEKAEKAKKIKEQFGDANPQWEKDKSDMESMAGKDKTGAGGSSKKPTKAVEDSKGPKS